MSKENFRFYIKVRTALDVQARVIHDELYSVYGDQAPGLSTVERWSKLFREGREELEDEGRSGRPISETTPQNIEQIRLLIDDDPYLTIEEIQEETGFSYGTIQRILTTHLNLRKITARYVPKELTDLQRAERVRICKENLEKIQQGTWRLCDIITGDESWFRHKQLGRKSSHAAWIRRGDPPPTVVRQNRYAPRTLLAIFFKSNGPLLIHRLEPGQTINHHYYIDNCLRPVVDEIKRQRPSYGTRGIKFHHDNGKPHVHNNVLAYLESEGLTVVPHPPNSPDLSPCDFWLFDFIKENLPDQSDSQSLHDAVISFMNSLSNEEYKKTFEKWIERMQLCIDNQGDYFEHLMK
jgi:histone-lysine N-methyltransferase SETMAR